MSKKAWFGGEVALDDTQLGDLRGWVGDTLPHATWQVPIDRFHVTLLYHGHPESDGLRAVFARHHLDTVSERGTISDIEAVFTDDGAVFVVLRVDAPPLQELHHAVRADVVHETGELSLMKPHLAPDGSHVHRYDYSPHVTLARYATADLFELDREQLQQRVNEWKGRGLTVGPFAIF